MFGSRSDKQPNKTNSISFAKSANSNNIDTLISDACQITGDINSEKSIKIDGQVTGNVCAKGTIVISSTGRIIGDINSESLIVYGNIDGNSVTQEIHLQQGGHVEGNIETQSLQVEPDATYNGVISMTQRLAHTIPVLPYATENMLDDEEAAS